MQENRANVLYSTTLASTSGYCSQELRCNLKVVCFESNKKLFSDVIKYPRGPTLTYNDEGGKMGVDIFGSEILAKRYFGPVEDAIIFWASNRNTGFFLGNVFFISSNQLLLYMWYISNTIC